MGFLDEMYPRIRPMLFCLLYTAYSVILYEMYGVPVLSVLVPLSIAYLNWYVGGCMDCPLDCEDAE